MDEYYVPIRNASDVKQFMRRENEKKQQQPKPIISSSFDPDSQYYLITINIISGTKQGSVAHGLVSFPQGARGDNQYANRFFFNYDNQCYSINETGAPKARVGEGFIDNLVVVAGPSHHRFGINGGFSRNQFQRSSEVFVRQGEEYFGYLYPSTIVDGVGTVSYEKITDNIEAVFWNYNCEKD